MPRLPQVGNQIKRYRITDHLNTGMMANAYAAQADDGRKVFFKWYKSPTVGKDWFEDYVDYQKELNRRVGQPALRRFCVHQLDSFVHKLGASEAFYQVYEFVEGGHDLGTIIERIRKDPVSLNWSQRTILAKVMMAGIHQLHEHKIVHCDLKPPNLQMLTDMTIEAGYQLKFIDMDFSVLSDRKAPWHGDGATGYVGTPGYYSPEHMRQEVPSRASDIFTCGLILYELLGEGHPYRVDDPKEYLNKINAFKAPPPKLQGALPDAEATVRLAETIRRCLSPKAADRPTAREVNLALNGRRDAPPVPTPRAVPLPPVPPKPTPTPPPPSATAESESTAPVAAAAPIKLSVAGGVPLTCNVSTPLGKALLRQFGAEARFADEHQFTLERRGLEWWLAPQNGTSNYTMLNGQPALTPARLKIGDLIQIGSRTTGKVVLPLTVTL